MLLFLASLAALLLSSLPVVMFLQNMRRYLPACNDPQRLQSIVEVPVSVLIPARNEAASIGPALDSILASHHRPLEILVLDDASEDATPTIVESYAQRDPRVRLCRSAGLPEGWNGKQNACWQLAQLARHERLLFLDADVRLSPDAIGRMVAEQDRCGAPLVSGFPLQETGTIAERMLIPLMHYVLLGFLPIDQMRASAQPGFAAGCGQLFLAKREPYMSVGGHSAIANSRHDGIKLPKAFRRSGYMTDLFDATDIARCRMYHNLPQVVRGLLKNATEGIANPT
ncbi:MAG: glycosyltransferase family 2 protein, partial [Pirellula sp.]